MGSVGHPQKPLLMVLGAGTYQIPVIRAAQSLGIAVLAIDRSADAPAAAIADHFAAVDTTDRARVLDLAKSSGIDGIVSPCTDVAVPTQAFVAAELGLPGPPLESTLILTDKERFRAYQSGTGLLCPFHVTGFAEALLHSHWPEGRYVIKPARSSGSKGVFICAAAEVQSALIESGGFDPEGRVVVERFVEGAQCTMEGFWVKDEITYAFVTDRQTAGVPFPATTGHRWPSRVSAEVDQIIRSAVARICQDLALHDTPFDCDFVASAEGPVILELTPRLGGNSLSQLALVANGYNLPKETAYRAMHPRGQALCSSPIETCQWEQAAAVLILHGKSDGRLSFDEQGDQALRAEAWVTQFGWDVLRGTQIRRFKNGRDRLGEALIIASDRDELDIRCDQFLEILAISSE
jgi:biotin carboxylase